MELHQMNNTRPGVGEGGSSDRGMLLRCEKTRLSRKQGLQASYGGLHQALVSPGLYCRSCGLHERILAALLKFI